MKRAKKSQCPVSGKHRCREMALALCQAITASGIPRAPLFCWDDRRFVDQISLKAVWEVASTGRNRGIRELALAFLDLGWKRRDRVLIHCLNLVRSPYAWALRWLSEEAGNKNLPLPRWPLVAGEAGGFDLLLSAIDYGRPDLAFFFAGSRRPRRYTEFNGRHFAPHDRAVWFSCQRCRRRRATHGSADSRGRQCGRNRRARPHGFALRSLFWAREYLRLLAQAPSKFEPARQCWTSCGSDAGDRRRTVSLRTRIRCLSPPVCFADDQSYNSSRACAALTRLSRSDFPFARTGSRGRSPNDLWIVRRSEF